MCTLTVHSSASPLAGHDLCARLGTKGASRRVPERLKLTEKEMQMLRNVATEEEAEELSKDSNGLPSSFKMDEYEEEDDDAAIKNYIGGGAGAVDDEEEDEATNYQWTRRQCINGE
ncbi:hypothetical protein Plhal304r1_c007g0028751 [Plasmopara halstedii]